VSKNIINPYHRKIAALLREAATHLETDPGARVAFCVFVDGGPVSPTERDVQVLSGGFRDDEAASRYLTSFIRNQGFGLPQASNDTSDADDEHEDA
jgi:hypothetical protein